MQTLHLNIYGVGTLNYAGGYKLGDVSHTSCEAFADAYAWRCPFEGARDGAFDKCSPLMPLSKVRGEILIHELVDYPGMRLDETSFADL